MSYTLNKVLIFAAGAAIGSAVTWKYVQNKYQRYMREEINKIKEYYAGEKCKGEAVEEPCENKNGIDTYKHIIADNGYTNYNSVSREEKEEVINVEKPYVIAPDEFGELDGYNEIELHYYTDGILADDDDNIIEDVEAIVGKDSLLHFGEYEDDSVFVRNDTLECDYAILMDYRGYGEMMQLKRGARPVEDR